MLFHENRLLSDDSHEMHSLYFQKLQNLSSAAVLICALMVDWADTLDNLNTSCLHLCHE